MTSGTGCRKHAKEFCMDFFMVGTLIICFLLVIALACWCESQAEEK